jgi:hypothetical protein
MKKLAIVSIGLIILMGVFAVHPAAEKAKICKACGEPITGPCFETQGDFYHARCFRCDYCNQPISESYVVYNGKKYHDFCFKRHVALTCAVCGGVITGDYLQDHWGTIYHPYHEGKVIRCDFCKRFIVGPLAKGRLRLPDGRCLCALCAPSAVTDVADARELMADVAGRLARLGIEVETASIDLDLAGTKKLRAVAKSGSHDLTGFVDYEAEKNLFGSVKRRKIKVYILHGMPRTQAAGAIAHELTHVWQFQHGRLKTDKALSEGSANYASYLVLKSIGGVEAEFIMENMLLDKDPDYGEGFRRVKGYAEREGRAAWLELLSNKESMKSSF